MQSNLYAASPPLQGKKHRVERHVGPFEHPALPAPYPAGPFLHPTSPSAPGPCSLVCRATRTDSTAYAIVSEPGPGRLSRVLSVIPLGWACGLTVTIEQE